ncbi:monocarboxylate transporter 12-like [Mizuhopecten yessoensis]|uniref:Monocarboxylate transporter 12 n=1 Tax=Mizuhopecten yessoensis TaxID=6573 RepID=A0A210QTH9_MIZYE|nr:monocarboxylate transporter 12-like [Mizuhopecten yessoensis]XP_021350128.1 monocarboxylate transporter 12-like [Mizuhopecten yessoensis]XP_021350129.1 monocarboxylate transporter 12-like [Mizuhopecten yessoensis]OWF52043.1 Monocarboxylate transporter 12 [Mizuhopecten yessoensis]
MQTTIFSETANPVPGEQTDELLYNESDSQRTIVHSTNRKDNSCDDSQDEDELSPPDGGWGWVIVFGSLVIHIILFGIEKSSGIFFLKFDEKFHQSAIVTAWVTTLPGGLRLILGPLCSMLTNKFSFRPIVMAGAVLMGLGMVLTGFANNMTLVFISFAIIEGLGMSLVYSPAVVIVGKYFTGRRGLAVGIATSSFGSFLFPTFIEFLFDYYGFLGAMLMLAGTSLNIMVCGSLFTPPPERKTRRRQKTSTDEINVTEQFLRPQLQDEINGKAADAEQSERATCDQECVCRVPCVSKVPCSTMCLRRSKTKVSQMLSDPRFATFCVALFLFSIAAHSAYAFIPLYAKQIAITDSQTTYVVALTILADGLGKVCLGAVLDIGRVKQYRVLAYNLTLVLVGLVYICLPSTSTFIQLCVVSSTFGLLFGGIMSQKSVVTADILGVDKLADAFGMLNLFQGAGAFIGPPISGLIKDTRGDNNAGFYFGGVTTIAGSVIFAVANSVHYVKSKQHDNSV